MPRGGSYALGLALGAAAAYGELMMGISYGPVPLMGPQGASQLPQDDWMCGHAVPMWGRAGRRDLEIIRGLGANVVRLYGNNADNDHTTFLDEARSLGLGVLPGMSDHPFHQTQGSCHTTNYNCFRQVKPLYLKNLQKGFLAWNQTYHPALRIMNILNEPDLKMPGDATNGGPDGPVKMCRAIISAFDAMLEAEKEAGVVGPLINLTATFSYAVCTSCSWFATKPALGQIAQLQDAMYHPEKYGYTPRNNITAAYEARFTHSFNTQNPATDMLPQFLDTYNVAFSRTPVYIGEYHSVGANQTQDVGLILDIASRNPLFQGISFFQYQVAYWKGGSEENFGIMGLRNDVLLEMQYFGKPYNVYCLDPLMDTPSGMLMADAVARVYKGSPMITSTLCSANPWGAAISQTGFASISSQGSASQMALYVEKVLQHMGATVVSTDGLNTFAQRFVSVPGNSFGPMMGALGGRPWWTAFDSSSAKCVADRSVDPGTVGDAIDWACQQPNSPNCSIIPAPCSRSAYTRADYIFSRYYEALGGDTDPVANCAFGGAGIFAASAIYSQWTGSPECVAGSSYFATTAAPASSTPALSTPASSTPASATTVPAVSAGPPTTSVSGSASSSTGASPTGTNGGVISTTSRLTGSEEISAAARPHLGTRVPGGLALVLAVACLLLL